MNNFEEIKKEMEKKYKEKMEAKKQATENAVKYIEDFRNSGEKYIAIRIRDGYIGKEMDNLGRKLQTERTKPRGTMVAIKGDNGKVHIGVVYKSNKDEDIPAVGVSTALKYAISSKNSPQADDVLVGVAGNCLKNKNDIDLLEFFKIRSLCYFWPEKYSHSRGSEKIEYPNYDLIHKNRKRVLGEED